VNYIWTINKQWIAEKKLQSLNDTTKANKNKTKNETKN